MMKENINQLMKGTKAKNLRYNRFPLLSCLLAGFFFSNLYWLLALAMSGSFLIILPLGLVALSIPAIAARLYLYGHPSGNIRDQLKWHRIYQTIQQVASIPVMVSVLLDVGFERLFPFLKNNLTNRQFVVAILLIGMLLSEIIIRKINHMYKQRDEKSAYLTEFSDFNE